MRGLAAIVVATSASACSTTQVLRRPLTDQAVAEVNEIVQGKQAIIALQGAPGEVVAAKDILFGPASTQWVERVGAPPRGLFPATPDWVPRAVPSDGIRQIVVRDHWRGLRDGLLIGGGIALGTGAAGFALFQGFRNNAEHNLGPYFTGIGLLMAAAAAPVLGSFIGAIKGHRSTIDFDPESTSITARPGAATTGAGF